MLKLWGVGVAVPTLSEGRERWASLGLEVLDSGQVAVGKDRINLVTNDSSSSRTSSGLRSYPHVLFETDDMSPWVGTWKATATESTQIAIDLPKIGSTAIISRSARREDHPGALALKRIESLPWAVQHRPTAALELERLLNLKVSPEHSNLVFPDLRTTNTLVFLGDSAYLDLNEGLEGRGAISKQVRETGNSQFAIVLEPQDLDTTAQEIHARRVPTLTEKPIELRVVWNDGTEGIAARILAIDPTYLFGIRVFLSEPTFPWPRE